MSVSSTNMHRTMESLQQVMHGLYPASKLGLGIIPTLLVRFAVTAQTVAQHLSQLSSSRNGKDENLVANVQNCKRLEILFLQFASGKGSSYPPITFGTITPWLLQKPDLFTTIN